MVALSVLIAAVVGGALAGVVALAVGGVGVLLQIRKMVFTLADGLDEINVRVEREIKRRAGTEGVRARGKSDEAFVNDILNVPGRDADAPSLLARANPAQPSRADVLRRAGLK